jgi:hypothetical protein
MSLMAAAARIIPIKSFVRGLIFNLRPWHFTTSFHKGLQTVSHQRAGAGANAV